MPFTLHIRTTGGVHSYWDCPDPDRPPLEARIAEFEAGTKPMEQAWLINDQPIARWCDIRDIWIEEA